MEGREVVLRMGNGGKVELMVGTVEEESVDLVAIFVTAQRVLGSPGSEVVAVGKEGVEMAILAVLGGGIQACWGGPANDSEGIGSGDLAN